jgi:hypothetical protein
MQILNILIKKSKILKFKILEVKKYLLRWGRKATIDMAIVILSNPKLELKLEQRCCCREKKTLNILLLNFI